MREKTSIVYAKSMIIPAMCRQAMLPVKHANNQVTQDDTK